MKIRKLQKKLTSTNGASAKTSRLEQMLSGIEEQNHALDRYLDFCVSDKQIRFVLERSEANRADLGRIYKNLIMNGAGQWVKGHYVAASSIAYAEPLTFILVANSLEASDKNISPFELTALLIDYWQGEIPAGGLYRMLGMIS